MLGMVKSLPGGYPGRLDWPLRVGTHPRYTHHMNAATRTKRVKAILRTLPVQILACYSEQREYTLVRVPLVQGEKALAMQSLTDAGWDVRDGARFEFTVWGLR